MSEGENMFAFQICNIPKTDQKIAHCEFLGCIAEDEEEEEEDEDGPSENEDDDHNKRGESARMSYTAILLFSRIIY